MRYVIMNEKKMRRIMIIMTKEERQKDSHHFTSKFSHKIFEGDKAWEAPRANFPFNLLFFLFRLIMELKNF